MITRIVKVKVKENSVTEFKTFMKQFVKETHEFSNNHHVDFFADKDEANHYHIYTIWKSEGALNKFRKSEINLEFKNKLKTWSESEYTAWTVENMA